MCVYLRSQHALNQQAGANGDSATLGVTPPSLGSSDADSTIYVAVQGCCEEANFRQRP
jgi:hypothetical protein